MPIAEGQEEATEEQLESSGRRYLRSYLRIGTPVAVALWRSVEAKHLNTIDLRQPILDLGCGFGEFAQVFFQEPADVGVDISPPDLAVAQQHQVYRNLVLADARRLPFVDGAFPTVISISVLEHIRGPNPVLLEAFRVLQPDGIFAFTTPLPNFDELMLVPRLLRRLRLSGAARFYARMINRFLYHVSLRSPAEWLDTLQEAGFRIDVYREILSPKATAMFDLFLLPAFAARVWRLVFKRRLARPAPLVRLLERWLLRYVEEDTGRGSNIFVVARKPADRGRPDRAGAPGGSGPRRQ